MNNLSGDSVKLKPGATKGVSPKPKPPFDVNGLGPPEQTSSALFGTLSFPTKNSSLELKYDYSELIAEIVRQRHPALLLCAGFSVCSKQSLKTIANATQQVPTIVLVEMNGGIGKAESYRIFAGQILAMGRQCFSERENTNEEKVHDLEEQLSERQFIFDKGSLLHGHCAFLLVCGELSVVAGRNNVEYDRHVEAAPKLRNALESATIIVNPTHSRMADRGSLRAKREFLSRSKRIYLSSSNWERSRKRKQNISRTLHSLWFDGKEKESKSLGTWAENDFFCYREWNVAD